MKSPVILAIALYIAIPAITFAALVYDIDFNGYAPGTSYTSALGPPNDFSTFTTSQSSTAQIELSALGLTNTPLVTTTSNGAGRASFGMSIAGMTNHIITLRMQLSLGTNSPLSTKAGISFYSDVESPNQTVFGVGFDADWSDIDNDPLNIVSYHGLVYLPTNDYSASSVYSRNTPHTLQVSANTLTHTFSVSLDNIPLATNAPFHEGQPLKHISISVGDLGTQGAIGQGAIDNILLDVQPANAVSFTAIAFTNNSSLRLDLAAPARQLILMEWSSDLVSWLPLHEWEIVGPTNYTVRAVYVATDDGIATVPDTPLTSERQKYYRAIPWTPPEEWQAPAPTKTMR